MDPKNDQPPEPTVPLHQHGEDCVDQDGERTILVCGLRAGDPEPEETIEDVLEDMLAVLWASRSYIPTEKDALASCMVRSIENVFARGQRVQQRLERTQRRDSEVRQQIETALICLPRVTSKHDQIDPVELHGAIKGTKDALEDALEQLKGDG